MNNVTLKIALTRPPSIGPCGAVRPMTFARRFRRNIGLDQSFLNGHILPHKMRIPLTRRPFAGIHRYSKDLPLFSFAFASALEKGSSRTNRRSSLRLPTCAGIFLDEIYSRLPPRSLSLSLRHTHICQANVWHANIRELRVSGSRDNTSSQTRQSHSR
jgi:hypothetical protein